MHNPPHPGLVLREYLGKTPLSAVASQLGTNSFALSQLLNGKGRITPKLARRLAETSWYVLRTVDEYAIWS